MNSVKMSNSNYSTDNLPEVINGFDISDFLTDNIPEDHNSSIPFLCFDTLKDAERQYYEHVALFSWRQRRFIQQAMVKESQNTAGKPLGCIRFQA